MFYVNKKEDVVELIYSEQGIVIVVDQQDSLMAGNPIGRIIKTGKKQFKKDFKKASDKFIKMDTVNKIQKEEIINTFLTDKYGIINHSEEYIERMKYSDRKEYFEGIDEETYNNTLKEFADKPVNRKDLLKQKEALQQTGEE